MHSAFATSSRRVLPADRKEQAVLAPISRRTSPKAFTEKRQNTRAMTLNEAVAHANGGKMPFFLDGNYDEETVSLIKTHLLVGEKYHIGNFSEFEKRESNVAVLVTPRGLDEPSCVLYGTRDVTVFH